MFGEIGYEFDTAQGRYCVGFKPREWGMGEVTLITGPETYPIKKLTIDSIDTLGRGLANGKIHARAYSAELAEYLNTPHAFNHWWDAPTHLNGKLFSPKELKELYASLQRHQTTDNLPDFVLWRD